MNGRTDSTILQHEGGIQSVIMGPGTIGTAHTRNEYVAVESLVTGTRAVLRAVEKLSIA
jgi:acetylornithine deacetylase/succinyl-diaminopimelate desuccinylase-like protein